ncbi:hypothetical protein RRG08_017867 [Elysia crispata]|uniref:Uncharacterized protein n=1 Tax=Elysia crispata TaxID=231223 RepID=A0AAE0XQ05_9GAST|nr:hypothetical protein RRG08_017867 [Elysia crispata]
MGSQKSESLNSVAKQLWCWCIPRGISDTAENPGGQCDGRSSRPILAKSSILPSSTEDADRQSSHTDCTHQLPPITISSRPHRLHKHMDVCLQSVRLQYANQGISDEAIDIIMSSWRPEIKKVYATYIRKWREFAAKRTQDPSSTSIATAIDFLTELHKQGALYSSLCIARSALSCMLRVSDDITFGILSIVKRLMKGFYELKPSIPQTAKSCTWSVDDVLNTLETWWPLESLTLKALTLKLVMLLAMLSGQRCQTL